MSPEVARFLPVAGMFVGLIVAFAFDPTSARAAWWCIPGGLLIVLIAIAAIYLLTQGGMG